MEQLDNRSKIGEQLKSSKRFLQVAVIVAIVAIVASISIVPARANTATGNGGLIQWAQGLLSSNRAETQAQIPMTLEEGVEALSGSGRTVVEVAAGANHSLAILSDGTLWAWGSGGNGQVGLGSTVILTLGPTQVGTDDDWDSISGGELHSLALRTDGTLWAFGRNHQGQLGLGHTNDVHMPTQVGADDGWNSITAGANHSLATRADGTLWSWGGGSGGRLGIGTSDGLSLIANRLEPTLVPTPLAADPDATWSSISAGGTNSLALRTDGTLWSWGAGVNGRHGLGHTNDVHTPTQVGTLTTWNSISAGGIHTLAIQSNGTLWSWGSGGNGRHGLGHTDDVHAPTQVGTLTTWDSVSAGGNYSLATRTDGTLWSWGSGGNGRHGLGHTDDVHTPTQVGTLTTWNSISAGGIHTLAIQSNGTLWSWGSGGNGRLGFESSGTASNLEPTLVHAQVTTSVPANAATNVPLATDTLSITFNRSMDANFNLPTGANGSISINNGASVNMSIGSWDHGDTSSTLTVPLTLTAHGTLHTVTVSGFGSIAGGFPAVDPTRGGFPAIDHTFNFRTKPEPQSGLFTKVLELPVGTTVPSPEFSFNFVAVEQRLNSEAPAIYSAAVDSFEGVVASPQTIRLDANDATTGSADIIRVTGELELWDLLDDTTFPNAGVFVWNVYEVRGSSNTEAPSHMSYDPNRFQIRAWVGQDGLEFIAVHALTLDEATSTWIAGDKLEEGITFNNSYRRNVATTPEHAALEISKEVSGQFANLTTPFSFRLDLVPHSLAPIDFSELDAFIYTGGTRGSAVDINPTGLGTTFTLLDNQRLVISTLPAGTTFSVVELAAAGFSPSVTVKSGGNIVHTQSFGASADLPTGTHVVRDSGRNAADFINEHRSATPTGLVIGNGIPVFFIAIVSVLILVALTAVRRRRAIEQLPVV